MPRATLSFDLPEDNAEFRAALAGREALAALHEIDQRCRDFLKYGDPPLAERAAIAAIRDMIPQELLEI